MTAPTTPTPSTVHRRSRLASLWLGQEDDPRWARPMFWAILILAGFLYTWGLSRNGTANDYYTAAVISGSKSLSAAFFGSLDTANFITVDKPPLALWLMIASVRVFGYSSWSMLLPQAAAGVATVAALYATVRRPLGHAAAVIAAIAMAFTPIVVAVNRWNTPDTLLVLFLVLAAWAMTRAIESGGTWWIVLSMVFIGLGFNVKMLQAWMVIPALGFPYLLAGRRSAVIRIGQLAAAAAVVIAVSASWMVIVDSIPAEDRPYIGGSKDNSVAELVTGHNGLARLASKGGPGGQPGANGPANQTVPGGGPGGGPDGGPGFSGEPGFLRLFNEKMGGQISWLLPISVLGLAIGLIAQGRKPRTDQARAAFMLWGIWLAIHAGLFSLSSGIIHEYYTNAMAPAMGALLGGGAVIAWRWMRERESSRSHVAAGIIVAAILLTGAWAMILLGRTPDWQPWLSPVVALAMIGASVLVLIYRYIPEPPRVLGGAAACTAVVAIVLAPFAYATTPLSVTSRDPLAGPASSRETGPRSPGQSPIDQQLQPLANQVPIRGDERQGQIAPDQPQPRTPQQPGNPGADGSTPSGNPDTGADPEVVEYLLSHRSGETWIAAATGSFASAPLIIATGGEPVMTMGGFGGNDPAPTLDELRTYVAQGEVRFIVVSQRGPGGAQTGQMADGRPGQLANARPDQTPGHAPATTLGAQPPNSSQDRLAWAVEACDQVNIGTTNTQLYDCAGATA